MWYQIILTFLITSTMLIIYWLLNNFLKLTHHQTVAVISLNLLMMMVLHDKNYSRYVRDLPKILMTSLSITDLAVGTLVTPISLVSVVYQCWPWSQAVCAVEALLIASLFHESTLSLLSIAIDRYICIVHPLRYHSIMTKKVFHGKHLSWSIVNMC